MRNILFVLTALVAMVSAPPAMTHATTRIKADDAIMQTSDPIARLGQIVATYVVDATTVLNFHEHGRSLAKLDVESGTVLFSMATNPLPSLKLSYVDTNGMRHEIETPFPSINPSDRQLRETIKLHKQIVAAMQAEFPPMQPQPTRP